MLHVHQHYIGAEVRHIGQLEVHKGDKIDSLDVIAPFLALLALSGDCSRQVVNAALLEKALLLVLHLYDDFLAVGCCAQHIVNQEAVVLIICNLFLVRK